LILGDRTSDAAPADAQTTLDGIFRRTLARRPDAIALADPPDRESFAPGAPRRLTYADADRVIAAMAVRLRRLGLQPDTVVGILLPNTVESVLTLLAVLRAGMIAAPLPVLWRHAEMTSALGQVGAKAIITIARRGAFGLCDVAMQAAAELFPVRYVCGFGPGLPDGVIPLDDLFDTRGYEDATDLDRGRTPALHVTLVTWEITRNGPVAVARNHAQLIAGGLATLLEGGLEPEANVLGCCATSSFAGLAVTVLPWLLAGGSLSLHHGFDAEAFAAQCREHRHDTVALPGPVVGPLQAAGLLSHAELRNVLALWRAPERLAISPPWRNPTAKLVDMLAFGEIALLGSRRRSDGRTVSLPAGDVRAPRDTGQAVWVAEIVRTSAGTLALRGPMVPRYAFPPGTERSPAPHLKADAAGFVDTGYACRLNQSGETVQVTGPPPGIVGVGGYRFVLDALENRVRQADGNAAMTALPDALIGYRLAGIAGDAGDADGLRARLAALGLNALAIEAFRDRGSDRAA
jgi:hypothetical protein